MLAKELIKQLEKRKEILQERIKISEKSKKNIIQQAFNILSSLKNGNLSESEYNNELTKKKQGKTLGEWLAYYNNYISNSRLQISNIESKIKKERMKNLGKIGLIICLPLMILFIFFIIKPIILTSPIEEFNQDLNLLLEQSQNYNLELENNGLLKSLKISGEIEGQGEVKIYLEDTLLLDSSNLEEIILASPESSPSLFSSPIIEESPIAAPSPVSQPSIADNILKEKTIIKKFSNFCEETCNLESLNLNKDSYNLRIEISNAKLKINSINYELTQPPEPEQTQIPSQSEIPTPTAAPIPVSTTTPLPMPSIAPTPIPSPVEEKIETLQETETKNSKIVIGQPIKWIKKIKIENQNKIRIEIPKEAVSIKIKHEEEIAKAEKEITDYEKTIQDIDKKDFVNGLIPALEITKNEEYTITETDDKKIINLAPINQEKNLAITYFTPGPEIQEKKTDLGKQIVISGKDNLQNILAYTNLENEVEAESIHLYHIKENEKSEVEIEKYDINSNGLIDNVRWIVPHLSNQTYELEINILTLQSYPAVGGNWIVEFNTTGKANLTIKAINGTTWSNENENNDLKFLEIKCGGAALNYEWINNSIFIKDYECNETSYELSKAITSGKHTLEFNFGGIKRYAYNLAGNNRIKRIIKGTGITSGINTDITISPALTDTSKVLHFISYRHTFANDHADTFKSSEIINPSTLRIFSDSSGGANPVNFEYTIIEFDSASPINVQRSTAVHSPGSIFPRLTSFTSIASLSQAFLINEGHTHNAVETSIGCEELDRIRLTSTTTWELNIGCAPNTGPQQNRVEIVNWNDPISLKAAQRGLATLTSSQTTLTITPPTLVDPTHTLLFISARATSAQTWNSNQIGLFAALNSAGNIIIERQTTSPGGASIQLAWELVEFNPGFANVQHVTINSITTNTGTAAISPIDVNNAIAIGTVSVPFGHGGSRNSATTNGGINSHQFTVTIPTATTVQVQRGTAAGTAKIGLQVISFNNYAPSITDISNIPDQIVTESGTTNVQFFVTVNDENGVRDLNDATITSQFSQGPVTRTGACIFDSDLDSTTRRYSCTVGIRYFDSPGLWTVSASIQDSKGLSSSYSETFNLLETACISISPTAMQWPPLFPEETDKLSSTNPLIISNTCNKEGSINMKAFDLLGESNPLFKISAQRFSIHTVGYCQPIDIGTIMDNNIDVPISGALVQRGENSLGQGQELLYFCIEELPDDLSSQTYSTPQGSQWIITILSAILIRKRRKKKITEDNIIEILELKLKEKYNININELFIEKNNLNISIPLSLFREKIGAAEVLCKYLKENKHLTFKQISSVLNRDQRTIWTNYNNAVKKNKGTLKIEEKDLISIEIFSNRKFSILESLVYYLKQKSLKNKEISKILNKDPRNVHTLYSRAMKKLKTPSS